MISIFRTFKRSSVILHDGSSCLTIERIGNQCGAVYQLLFQSTLKPTHDFRAQKGPKQALTAKKRAGNSYAIFVKEKFPVFKSDVKDAKDIMRLVVQEWQKLTSEEKKVYADKSSLMQQQLDEEYEKLSEEEKSHLISNLQMKYDRQYQTALKQVKIDSGKPKRTVSARSFFLMQTKGSTMTFAEKLREYSSLPEGEKEKYMKLQEEDKIRYKKEMLEWMENTASSGKGYLVTPRTRRKYLLQSTRETEE